MKHAAAFSSEDQTWNTPRWFIARLERFLGRVQLDPCSNEWSVVDAVDNVRLDQGRDGLSFSWARRGLVFLNPPYGDEISPFMEKLPEADEAVALVPSRTDTVWWQGAADSCSALVLWSGRLRFTGRREGPGQSAPFPSTVFYFGERTTPFLDAFIDDGIAILRPEGARISHMLRRAA